MSIEWKGSSCFGLAFRAPTRKSIIDYKRIVLCLIKEFVIDSSYVLFRLTEILDGAGFPLSRFYDD